MYSVKSITGIPAVQKQVDALKGNVQELTQEDVTTEQQIVETNKRIDAQATDLATINRGIEGSAVGVTDYIASGLKLTTAGGYSVKVSPGVASIAGEPLRLDDPVTLTLDPSTTEILYAMKLSDSKMTIGKVKVAPPDPDAYTIARYTFTEAGAPADTSGNGNHMTVNGGISTVNGRWGTAKKGDGVNGYMQTTGNITSGILDQERETDVVFTPDAAMLASDDRYLFAMGSGSHRWDLLFATGLVRMVLDGTAFNTTFYVGANETYEFSLTYSKQWVVLYWNGFPIYTLYISALATVAAPMKVFTAYDNSTFSSATIHYLEHRSKIRNRNEMHRMCNKMGLPTRYHAFSYPENPVDTPSHVWKFNSITTDNKVLDDMGTMHGTVVGTPSIVESDGGMKAIKLNGTTDYLSLGVPLKINQAGKGFTVLAAVKADTTSSPLTTAAGKTIISNYKDAASLGGHQLLLEGVANPRPCVINLNNGYNYAENRIGEGDYSVIGYTYDSVSKTISWYVNSIFPETPKSFTLPDGFFNGTANVCIGADGNGNSRLPGEISYLMITDRCLSQGEMAEKILPLLSGTRRSLKDDALPSKAIPLGRVTAGKASSNDGIVNIDMVYKNTHRIEGATKREGNRSTLLGVKWVTPGQKVNFYNPFGLEHAVYRKKFKPTLPSEITFDDNTIYFETGRGNAYGSWLDRVTFDSIRVSTGNQAVQYSYSGSVLTSGWLYLYGELL